MRTAQAAVVDLIEQRIIVALADERNAETSAVRHEKQAADARATAAARRLEIGQMLLKARGAWPQSGPNAKGWGDFLARIKLDDSTAWRYMDEAKRPKVPSQNGDARENAITPPANVHGGSGEVARGTYCTPLKYAMAVGSWDLDPFSNPRSHIVSTIRCMLERGDDGLPAGTAPGTFHHAIEGGDGHRVAAVGPASRVWIQPPYDIVEAAIAHYKHTRFCALLRFAPDVAWFAAMWPHVHVVAIPFGERLPFEIDGVEADGAPFPHAFYYADERDVTDEIRKLCLVWRVDHPTTNT